MDYFALRLHSLIGCRNLVIIRNIAARLEWTLREPQSDNLKYIPEAHNYLKFKNKILDFTKKNSSENDFINDLLEEIEIEPHKINQFKIEFHKNYLKNWLAKNPQIPFSLDELWKIREECIKALS